MTIARGDVIIITDHRKQDGNVTSRCKRVYRHYYTLFIQGVTVSGVNKTGKGDHRTWWKVAGAMKNNREISAFDIFEINRTTRTAKKNRNDGVARARVTAGSKVVVRTRLMINIQRDVFHLSIRGQKRFRCVGSLCEKTELDKKYRP